MFTSLIITVTSVVLFRFSLKFLCKFIRGDFYFPLEKDVSEIEKDVSEIEKDVSEISDKQKDFCELPDKQKDFIQLN